MNKYILVHLCDGARSQPTVTLIGVIHLGKIVWSISTLFNALNKKVPLSVVVPRDFSNECISASMPYKHISIIA